MKLIFNDATELVIQSADIQSDGGLLIKGPTAQWSDKNGNVRIQIGQDVRKNFTFSLFDETGTGVLIDSTGIKEKAIAKYTAGITGVILYKVGETPAEKIEALTAENAELKKAVDMLQGCILEMSELVYQ